MPLRKEPARDGHAAADRRRGLRPVGVRRHARRAHRRDRRHRRRRRGSGSRAASASSSCAAAARSAVPGAARRARRRACRLLSVLPGELPAAIERLQAEAKDRKRESAALADRAVALPRGGARGGRGTGRAACASSRAPIDADANGLKALASAITSASGFVVALVSSSTPALVGRRALCRRGAVRAADSVDADREIRRTRRRKARTGAGRRVDRLAGRHHRGRSSAGQIDLIHGVGRRFVIRFVAEATYLTALSCPNRIQSRR